MSPEYVVYFSASSWNVEVVKASDFDPQDAVTTPRFAINAAEAESLKHRVESSLPDYI